MKETSPKRIWLNKQCITRRAGDCLLLVAISLMLAPSSCPPTLLKNKRIPSGPSFTQSNMLFQWPNNQQAAQQNGPAIHQRTLVCFSACPCLTLHIPLKQSILSMLQDYISHHSRPLVGQAGPYGSWSPSSTLAATTLATPVLKTLISPRRTYLIEHISGRFLLPYGLQFTVFSAGVLAPE